MEQHLLDEHLLDEIVDEIAHYRQHDHGPKDMINISNHVAAKYSVSNADAMAAWRVYLARGGDKLWLRTAN